MTDRDSKPTEVCKISKQESKSLKIEVKFIKCGLAKALSAIRKLRLIGWSKKSEY